MMKKEQLAEMNNHELLCELVYSQQMTRFYILILLAVCIIAAVYLCVTVSSAASSIKTGSEALTQLSGPMTEALEKLSSFDMNAFNKAIESFTNLLKGLPFFGG